MQVNTDLQALKLVLDQLNVGTSIDDISQRKEKQKAIYLARLAGVDLGYPYGWYVRGPYSPSLTKHYYELQSSTGEITVSLKKEIVEDLDRLKVDIFESSRRPQDLGMPDWLELLASWHYLRTVSKYDKKSADKIMSNKKKHVSEYTDIAEELVIPT